MPIAATLPGHPRNGTGKFNNSGAPAAVDRPVPLLPTAMAFVSYGLVLVRVRGISERGTIRKSPQAHKHFCPLLPTATVFVSYGFVLVQVQVQGISASPSTVLRRAACKKDQYDISLWSLRMPFCVWQRHDKASIAFTKPI
jgi:hypothetical protein